MAKERCADPKVGAQLRSRARYGMHRTIFSNQTRYQPGPGPYHRDKQISMIVGDPTEIVLLTNSYRRLITIKHTAKAKHLTATNNIDCFYEVVTKPVFFL